MPKKNRNSERLLSKVIFVVLFKSSETFQGDLHVPCTVQKMNPQSLRRNNLVTLFWISSLLRETIKALTETVL